MTCHVVCRAGPADRFVPDMAAQDSVLEVPFDQPGHPAAPRSSIPDVFSTYLLRPLAAADDLLRAAIGAYTADLRISRSAAYDNWTRDIALHIPVQDTAGWSQAAPVFERLLAFLTGDRWTVYVRSTPFNYRPNRLARPKRRRYRIDVGVVSLFSGGLDSYVGAIDQAERCGPVVLVGHHSAGGGATSVAQDRSLAALRTRFSARHAPFLQFWVSPPIGTNSASEITTRGRSVLFMALGIAVASGLGVHRFVVPENGLISLNVPLTPARIGSFSTRTTHPYLMAIMRELLAILAIPLDIELPYRFQTKGEMIAQCANQDVLARGLAATMSCSHPGVGRFDASRNPNQHCGRCLPCLIRRAAIAASRLDPTTYAWSDLTQPLSPTQGADLRAVRMALGYYARTPARLADIQKSGPLPGSDEDLRGYVDVFQRGMAELRQFVLVRGQEDS